MKTRKSSQGVE